MKTHANRIIHNRSCLNCTITRTESLSLNSDVCAFFNIKQKETLPVFAKPPQARKFRPAIQPPDANEKQRLCSVLLVQHFSYAKLFLFSVLEKKLPNLLPLSFSRSSLSIFHLRFYSTSM